MSGLILIMPNSRGPRRGLIALSLATAFMLIVFTTLMSFTLGLAAQSLRVENAWAATQALYAAEAGVDVALQTGRGQVVGQCGGGRYAAVIRGGQITAVGQVERISGAPMRRAVMVQQRARGGIVPGSWRLVPPAQQTELLRLVEQDKERGRP